MANNLIHAPLGKTSDYSGCYDPTLLFPISRQLKRDEIGVQGTLPFKGCDLWNAYEVSWLNPKGKPVVALAVFSFPCTTPNLIESKSFKLYLNSFNQTQYDSAQSVKVMLEKDLSENAGGQVTVALREVSDTESIVQWQDDCIDNLDVTIDTYALKPEFLSTSDAIAKETLVSHLLKSNCLVTGQPDWASVKIDYKGPAIDREGLLKYIVSFREHNEFHEQCVERMFVDIMQYCKPTELTVYARYTRRGGLDINPIRSTNDAIAENGRLVRQ